MLKFDPTLRQLMELRGRAVYSRSGEQVGRLESIVLDGSSGERMWLGLRRGMIKRKRLWAPAGGMVVREDGLRLPYTTSQIESAPWGLGPDEAIPAEAYMHYGLAAPPAARRAAARAPRAPEPVPMGGTRVAGAVTVRRAVEERAERRRLAVEREVLVVQRQAINEPVEQHEFADEPAELTITLYDHEPVVTTHRVAKEQITLEKQREPGKKQASADAEVGGREYGTPEDPAPEVGDKHDHHFAEEKRGDRKTA